MMGDENHPLLEDDETLPLSHAQRRLWFLDRLLPERSLYNVPVVLRLGGSLDAPALEASLNGVIARHEALRTHFVERKEGPVQVVAEALTIEIERIDLRRVDAETREREVEMYRARESAFPFDLSRGPLLRATLLQLEPERHVLLLVLHHIVCDGWSLGILVQEIAAFYAHFSGGVPLHLPDLAIQYPDYAIWQNAQDLDAHRRYWMQALAGVPSHVEFPTDHPRTETTTHRGRTRSRRIDLGLSRALSRLARENGVSLATVLLAAFQVLLHRRSREKELLIGMPVANRTPVETEPLIGLFVNTVVIRTVLEDLPSFAELLERVHQTTIAALEHGAMPFEQLIEALRIERMPGRNALFEVMFVHQNAAMPRLELGALSLAAEKTTEGAAKFDLTLSSMEDELGIELDLEYKCDLFEDATIDRLLEHLEILLRAAVREPAKSIAHLESLSCAERSRLLSLHGEVVTAGDSRAVHHSFEAAVDLHRERIALVADQDELTYGMLDRRANALAHHLIGLGLAPGELVAVYLERSLDLVVALLAILKAGCAYVPLDPKYPAARIELMLRASGAAAVVTSRWLGQQLPEFEGAIVPIDGTAGESDRRPAGRLMSLDQLAYVIYTSGSTGTPKGVMVAHKNVANFFAALDQKIPLSPESVWLAVTSVSFDISVLELLWTLTRGSRVVLSAPTPRKTPGENVPPSTRPPSFSLFYFASDDDQSEAHPYQLLLAGAKFADHHGFEAVWTPERHFHAFGGRYPNPSVTGAAVAAVTERVHIRAGSVVLPLHDPLRVAEEWAVVDNLSRGRSGISFASGWHSNDFVFSPHSYATRKAAMLEGIEVVRRLWRGEAVQRRDPSGKDIDIRTRPAPIQKELPFWITAADNPDTFRTAGELGANVLTHLLGQDIDTLAQKIALYRDAANASSHAPGRVTLMLHTFVGQDASKVERIVREPFKRYLRSSLGLVASLAEEAGFDPHALGPEQLDGLLEMAFERYWKTSALFGTPAHCLQLVERLSAIGVDEIACLIDFGVRYEDALESLELVDLVQKRAQLTFAARSRQRTLDAEIREQGVTHMQCTPSFARMATSDPRASSALASLRALLVGGEALLPDLAASLATSVAGDVFNMYGPTETTIWSSIDPLDAKDLPTESRLGVPIANTQFYVLDENLELVAENVPGELYIGGAGVAAGYLREPRGTATRFLPDPFSGAPGQRIYATGDLVRRRRGHVLEFLGRIDQQVKIRGFRVEIGEIESLLNQHPAVREAAVLAVRDRADSWSLSACVVAQERAPSPQELQRFLETKLPDFMVPTSFVDVPSLPRTPNGKLDRRALPELAACAVPANAATTRPASETEAALAQIWEEVLQRRPRLDDDFFTLGGHSLSATQVVARVRETFSVELSLREFFANPTVAGLARAIDTIRRPARPPVLRMTDRAAPALSFPQQRLWFLDQLGAGNAYNMTLSLRIEGPLDVEALSFGLQQIVRRHEILRTTFVLADDGPVQKIADTAAISLSPIVLSHLDASARERELMRLNERESTRIFDLAEGPLFRVELLQLQETEHVLLVSMHHIISDGRWSLGIFVEELAAIYHAHRKGAAAALPPLSFQYADFAAWQRHWLAGEPLAALETYWREQLTGAVRTELPLDHPRPEVASGKGATLPFAIDAGTSERLKALRRQYGATTFMVMLAALSIAVRHLSGWDPLESTCRHASLSIL